MLRRKEKIGSLHGFQISRGAPVISHLFFAIDCYLFFQASLREGCIVKSTIQSYKKSLGQMENLHKSSIMFSPNVVAKIRT